MQRVLVTMTAWLAVTLINLPGMPGGSARAEESAPSDTVEILTGADQREWVITRWVIVLKDEAGRCTSGESLVFRKDGTGSRLVCEQGQRKSGSFTWSWSEDLRGENGIVIDDETYLLDVRQQPSDLPDEPPILVAILRTPRADQGTPVQEVRLEYWER